MSYLLLSRVQPPAAIAPKPSGFGWGGAFDSLGFRLTSARNSLVPGGIAFESAALGSVITKDFVGRGNTVVSTAALAVEDMNLDDLDDWWLELCGSNFRATIRGEVDQSAGVQAITLRPKLNVSPWAAPSTVLVGFTLDIKLAPIGGDASACRILIPGIVAEMESEVVAWQDSRLAGAGKAWNFPGKVWEGDVNGLPYDEPRAPARGDHPATCADIYFWDDSPSEKETCEGGCLRIPNATGAARIIRISRDGSNVITVSVTFVCQDASIGINGQSDTDFLDGLQFRPMTGEEFDALSWCRDREIAEGWAWSTLGPIGTNTLLSSRTGDLLVSGYADGGNLLADFQPYLDCYLRLKLLWGLAPSEMFVQIYRAVVTGTRPPNVAPMDSSAAIVIQLMHDAAIAILLYEDLLEPWSLSGGSGIDDTSPVWDLLSLTRTGYSLPGYPDLGDQPIANGEPSAPSVKYHINPLDPAALEDYFDEAEAEYASEIGTKRSGSYCDIAGVNGARPDDRASLDPEDRGIGSTTFAAASRAQHVLRRDRMENAGITDPILSGEFVNPMTTVGAMDVCYANPIYPPGSIFYGRSCRSHSVKYGRYIQIATYFDWAAPHGPQWDAWDQPDWANPLELRQYTWCRWFESGILLPMQRVWLDADPTGFVVEPDEAGYDDYIEFLPSLNFARDLYIRERDMVKAILTRSIPMRELDSSLGRRARAWENGAVDPVVPAGKVGSMIAHIPAAGSVVKCSVAVYFNWSRDDGNPATVTVADTIRAAGWPMLGAEAHDVYLWNLRTGVRFSLPDYDGSDYEISIDVRPSAIMAVLFVPAGEEPPFMGEIEIESLSASTKGTISLSASTGDFVVPS